nr:hypothetical protein CFP56_68985 [Quercus suber]
MRTGLHRQRKSSFFVVNAKGVTTLDKTSLYSAGKNVSQTTSDSAAEWKVDETIEDLKVSVGEVNDRIEDTQCSGNMSMNPPIEFDITIILKTTNKE